MKSTYTLLFLFFLAQNHCFSQELIVNGGFEIENKCSEFKQPCSPLAWYSTSHGANAYGYVSNLVYAKKGKRYSYIVVNDISKRQYIQTWLGCPVKAGEQYKLSFLLRKTDNYEFIPFGLYFSNQFEGTDMKNLQDERSQVIITEKNINSKLKPRKWSRVTVQFTAPLDAEFMTVGNFGVYFPKMGVPIPKWHMELEEIRYYVDEFSLQPVKKMQPCSDENQRLEKLFFHRIRHTHLPKPPKIEPKKTDNIFENPPKSSIETKPDTAKIIKKQVPEIITLPSVFFEFDQFEIQERYRDEILAALLPLAKKTFAKLEIFGHTDNKGSEKYNKMLSYKRAETIRNLLITNNLAKENQIRIDGKGASQPVADNAIEEGRQQNRRVEILIYW
jgi:outer membrane protein OmpA-like peptidoglycan-associated protein